MTLLARAKSAALGGMARAAISRRRFWQARRAILSRSRLDTAGAMMYHAASPDAFTVRLHTYIYDCDGPKVTTASQRHDDAAVRVGRSRFARWSVNGRRHRRRRHGDTCSGHQIISILPESMPHSRRSMRRWPIRHIRKWAARPRRVGHRGRGHQFQPRRWSMAQKTLASGK